MKKVTKIDEVTQSKVTLQKIRVAAYCRVSTDSDAQLESLKHKKDIMRATSGHTSIGHSRGFIMTKASLGRKKTNVLN